MGWDLRGKCRSYTRSRRVKGRVVREYYGTGVSGELAATLDELRRVEQAQRQQVIQQELDQIQQADKQMERYCEAVQTLARATLYAHGFHQHNRGEWRRRKMSQEKQPNPNPKPKANHSIRELLSRAEAGDQNVLPQLRAYLDENPQVWKEASDLGQHAAQALIGVTVGSDLFRRECLQRHLEAMQQELIGETSSPLERVLAERIALSWLQVTYADSLVTHNLDRDLSAAQQRALKRRHQQAHQRLLSATKMLATVRKLLPTEPKEETGREPESVPSKPKNTTLKARNKPEPTNSAIPEALAERFALLVASR